MSLDESKPGKSRRRFLADMLFLGGSVTAASLLAKTALFHEKTPPPSPGRSPAPAVLPEPEKTPEALIPNHPTPGKVALPEGDYVEPQPKEEALPPKTEDCPPMIQGRMKPPEPNPAGGARPSVHDLKENR